MLLIYEGKKVKVSVIKYYVSIHKEKTFGKLLKISKANNLLRMRYSKVANSINGIHK